MKPAERLPIEEYKDVIKQAVGQHDVVVITAETGAGKSTQVPQYLMEGGKRVVVTQPRRLAARTVAKRVAEEVVYKLKRTEAAARTRGRAANIVGYRTAFEHNDTPDTKALFCTDGLQMVRELLGRGNTDVLVIDEVHEWNINIETLVAWTRKQIQEGRKMKLVLMSATMEAEKLAEFYGEDVPVISVPGRMYPVSEKQAGPNEMISSIKELVKKGRNVLVFQPGKREIAQTIEALAGINAEVLPLHGELTPEEQQACFRSYDRPKVIVSTNVAQTSVTIPDIDAVVDSGMERRKELDSGIENLFLKPVSKADCMQRKGRAGRCREGEYILASELGLNNRPEFPKAEIERSRLDQLVLRLAAIGIDATELDFFHQPDKEVLKEGKRALYALGAMTKEGEVTKTGEMMSRFPLSVQYSRMLLEAQKMGATSDVLSLVAILESGSLKSRDRDEDGELKWKKFTKETESDLLAELDLWEAAGGKSNNELRNMGISSKNLRRAEELRIKLIQELEKMGIRYDYRHSNRTTVMKACAAGMVDHLYLHQRGDNYKNGDDVIRYKDRESVVTDSPEWIVGLPSRNFINMVTKVDPEWLTEVAPQLAETEEGLDPFYDPEQDSCISTTKTHFNGQKIKAEEVLTPEHEKAAECFAKWLTGKMTGGSVYSETEAFAPLNEVIAFNRENQKKSESLNTRAGEEVFPIMSSAEWQEYITAPLNGARRLAEITDFDALKLPEHEAGLAEMILEDNPDTITIEGMEIPIEYSREYDKFFVRANIEESLARQADIEKITLPGGRTVILRSNGYAADSFPELAGKLEKQRIRQCWSEKRSELEYSLQITKPEEAFPHLSNILSAEEITRTNNGEGEPVNGYYSLCYHSYFKYMVKLRDSREEAEKETLAAFKEFLKEACHEALIIPDEPLWKKVMGYYSSVSPANLTESGQILQSRLDALVTECTAGLNSDNAAERIRYIQESAEGIKKEITEEKSEAERIKAELKKKAEDARQEVLSELNDLRFAQNDFTEATDDECDKAGKITKELIGDDPENIIKKAEQAKVLITEVRQAMPSRMAERRARFPESLWEAADNNEQLIERFVALSEEAIRLAGDENDVLEIFEQELSAPYGCARRQCAIQDAIPGIDESDIGAAFLSLSRARDVNAWLAGAIVYLRSNQETDDGQEQEQEQEKEEKIQGNGIFTYSGGRHFQCSCGCMERVSNGQMKQYESGEAIDITCIGCGVSGKVQDESKNQDSAAENGAENAGPEPGGATLADLMNKFNG